MKNPPHKTYFTPAEIEKIKKLLLSSDESAVKEGLELLKEQADLTEFKTELFLVAQFSNDTENRSHAKKCVLPLLSTFLQKFFSRQVKNSKRRVLAAYIHLLSSINIKTSGGLNMSIIGNYLLKREPDNDRLILDYGTSEEKETVLRGRIKKNTLILNQLGSLPSEIGQFPSLVKLLVHSNWLEDLPPEIGRLKELEQLDLSGCVSLKALPGEMAQLKKLKALALSGEKFSDLPAVLWELETLTDLELIYFKSEKTLPPQIAQLKKLEKLCLGGFECLTKFPPEIVRLENLRELILSSFKSLTILPKEICELKNLRSLQVRYCENLTQIPPEIGQLQKLTELELRNCQRLKNLPHEIRRLKKLKLLSLYDCNALATLEGIGELENLEELDLTFCHSLRSLPAEIGSLGKLKKLTLAYHKFMSVQPVLLKELEDKGVKIVNQG